MKRLQKSMVGVIVDIFFKGFLIVAVFFQIAFGQNLNLVKKMRTEIKRSIDQIYSFRIIEISHTTDKKNEEKIVGPQKPMPFEAGRYKIIFTNENESKVIICETEEIVPHVSTIIPGKTVIGGYVLLYDEIKVENNSGTKLNHIELEYLAQMLYKKLKSPYHSGNPVLLNKIKDYVLAIMFSGKKGIDDFHIRLLNEAM